MTRTTPIVRTNHTTVTTTSNQTHACAQSQSHSHWESRRRATHRFRLPVVLSGDNIRDRSAILDVATLGETPTDAAGVCVGVSCTDCDRSATDGVRERLTLRRRPMLLGVTWLLPSSKDDERLLRTVSWNSLVPRKPRDGTAKATDHIHKHTQTIPHSPPKSQARLSANAHNASHRIAHST